MDVGTPPIVAMAEEEELPATLAYNGDADELDENMEMEDLFGSDDEAVPPTARVEENPPAEASTQENDEPDETMEDLFGSDLDEPPDSAPVEERPPTGERTQTDDAGADTMKDVFGSDDDYSPEAEEPPAKRARREEVSGDASGDADEVNATMEDLFGEDFNVSGLEQVRHE